ncbi:MAG: hypothetical protein B7Z37_30775 [Verrucomicrobia bacterium 12-59-8]|nr:MAG: hypothetical protein B7Z37_30775 [Verrucomicrobia bacterium 12-59-8]
MPGSILDEAYEEKRKLEKQERLQALMDDPAYGTPDPAPLTAVDTPPAPEAPEEEVDLWTEAPDRPQRISQKKERVGPSSMGEAFVRDLMAVPGTVAETAPALIPGWQKLFHDSQAFFLENPNGLPRDWQLMSDESEDYFSKFPQPDAGEVTGAMPFRSAAESKVVNKAVKTAQLRAAVQEARLRVALPTSENKFQQGVIDTTFNVGMMAPSMVAGIATKNPVLAVSLMMSQTGMGSYGDARRAGADPTKAYRYGLTMATIEGLTEFMPTKLLIGDMVAKTDFVEAFTKQMVADGLGEQAATHLQDLTTWLELNPDKTLDEFLAERPAAAIRTAIASAMTSTLLSGGTTALSRMMGDKESPAGEPTPEAPPAASEAAPPPEPAPTPEPVPAPADAPAGEAETQTPEQAELLDKVNKVADAIEIAQSQERAPITPQEESEDQRFVRGVESALGIKRPAAPVETAEERRARFSARRADEERQTQESTANVVANVRTFAEARNAAEQTVERAIEEPSPETVVAAVAAQSELAEQTETEPVSLAEAMDVDTTDRTSTMAEAERMAAELEAMDSEDAKSAASTFRTLIQYSDRYDDNTFWQGFDEALEYAAPHLMTETQQAAVIEKVAEAVEAAPLAPEEEASATLVEEVRATAPASRYFGRKSFGGEGLATKMPAAEAAPPAPAAAPQPARLPPKPAPISNTQLAAITAKEGKLSRPVQAREAMLLRRRASSPARCRLVRRCS